VFDTADRPLILGVANLLQRFSAIADLGDIRDDVRFATDAARVQHRAEDEERGELTRLVRSKLTSVRLAQRERTVLLAADGVQNKDIAELLDVGRVQVARWRERYGQLRLAGIQRDLPRGAPPVKVDVARLVALTTQSTPAAATHWSTRKMGAELGVSASTIMRHWHAHGLKPHIVRGFKVSRDPRFVQKLQDIVGLYMSPPEHALVLCCDEKSQVQALDRTQPGLPMKKGRAATMTHDYKRNGTTTLFAALNVLDGQVIGQCQQRHTHVEWLKFLRWWRRNPTITTKAPAYLVRAPSRDENGGVLTNARNVPGTSGPRRP
jgi:hypothetical protein